MNSERRKSAELVGEGGVTYYVSNKGIGIFVDGSLVSIKDPVAFFKEIEEVKNEFYGWVR